MDLGYKYFGKGLDKGLEKYSKKVLTGLGEKTKIARLFWLFKIETACSFTDRFQTKIKIYFNFQNITNVKFI